MYNCFVSMEVKRSIPFLIFKTKKGESTLGYAFEISVSQNKYMCIRGALFGID